MNKVIFYGSLIGLGLGSKIISHITSQIKQPERLTGLLDLIKGSSYQFNKVVGQDKRYIRFIKLPGQQSGWTE